MSRRRRRRSAVSLFAFQDIITSVTGIMILVTLILTIELLTRTEASPTQRTQEITEDTEATLRQLAENRRAIEAMRSRLTDMQENVGKLSRHDAEELEKQIADARAVNEQLQLDVRRIGRDQQDTIRRRQELESANRKLTDSARLKQISQQLAERTAKLRRLKSTNPRIFNRSQGDAKTPWLVEITAETIRAAKVGVKGRPQQFSSVSAFNQWALERDESSEYFVVLMKPDGIQRYGKVKQVLLKERFDVVADLLLTDQAAIDIDNGAWWK